MPAGSLARQAAGAGAPEPCAPRSRAATGSSTRQPVRLQMSCARWARAAEAAHISPEIMHRIAAMGSAAMDILPHNGAVITLLAICGLTHKQSYFDLFIVGSLTAFIASILVLGLYLA